MAVTSLMNALIIQAVGAPIVFALISMLSVKNFRHAMTLQTAAIFVAFVTSMNLFLVVAIIIQRSVELFASVLGTWILFVLIFLLTYFTGGTTIEEAFSP